MISTILEIAGFLIILASITLSATPFTSGASTTIAILGATLVIYGLAKRIIKRLKSAPDTIAVPDNKA